MSKIHVGAAIVASLIAAANPAAAATLFFDDFESGSLSATRWLAGSGGVVDNDPLQSDRALRFDRLASGGDLLSVPIGTAPGTYILSFDYLGTCGYQDCGGFIGHEPGDVWDAGSIPSYPTTLSPGYLVDDGAWHHYSITFTGGSGIQLQLEDFSGSGGTFGDVWFDNIQVTDAAGPSGTVPEPLTLALLALALGTAAAGRVARRGHRA